MNFSINNFINTCIKLRFIDSYKHLPHPLDELVKYLLNKDTNIQSIKNTFPSLFQHFNNKVMKLLRKGVYPYDYMNKDLENKLKEKELPNIKYFDSKLNNTECLIDGYNYSREFYHYFDCKDISDYNDLYVKTDVFCFWLMYLLIIEKIQINLLV